MKFSSNKRRWAAPALVLLALFLIRPGASRLKSRIIYSISTAVGRPVDIGAVHLRLLPRPGFDLNNLLVYDDPGFGAEPMLRASEVTADLRLMSLLKGRLEIARLDLTEPSLNLTREIDGRWNFENMLERTARIPLAPTGQRKSEPRPAFPYIQGTSGRINFKNGAEKRPYALTNADFALWQESDNAWGMRLKALPFRSDMNLNDMGLLQLNGTWQRSQEIRDTPLQFSIEWSRAQLGQLTKFLTGTDQGWRGEILLDVALKGTPAKLQISANSSVDDFRRYDITSGKALHMAAYCDMEYSSVSNEFRQVMCNAPVANGLVTFTGNMGLPGSKHYSFVLTAEKVSANALVHLAQRTKKNLPDDLAADGILRANVSLENDGTQPRLAGKGEIAGLHLTSASTKGELGSVTVPFALTRGAVATGAVHRRLKAPAVDVPDETRFEFGPFTIGPLRGTTATVRGWINHGGYGCTISGETEIAKVLRLARMVGVPALNSTADGVAQVDLQIVGTWSRSITGTGADFAGPQVTGTAELRNVQIAARNFGGPVEIGSAEMQLAPGMVRVAKLNAKAAGTTWTGSLQMPRGCGSPDACPIRFVLSTQRLSLADASEWARATSKKRPWYRLLGSNASPTLLPALHAVGEVSADLVQVNGVQATHVSSAVTVDNGEIQFSALTADVLDGQHRGEWIMDFGTKPAVCKVKGSFATVSSVAVADAMDDGWIAGTANASYELKGICGTQFWRSVEGTVRADLKDGSFPHILIGNNEEPLRVLWMSGQAQLSGARIEIADTEITTGDGTYQLSGTASFERELDLKMNRVRNNALDGFTISGTLSEPRVTPVNAGEQAHLKSLSAQ